MKSYKTSLVQTINHPKRRAVELDLVQLFSKTEDVETFFPGEVIFHQGDASDRMFVILEGTVEIVIDERSIDTLNVGETLGEMALVDNKPRSATAMARTQCRLAPVDEKRFLFMVQNTPFFALHMLRVFSTQLRTMDGRI